MRVTGKVLLSSALALFLPTHNFMSKQQATLFSFWRSSCSWRVRIALAHKQIPYNYVAVDLFNKQHLTLWYRAQSNNSCEVPCLSIHGHILTESLAILEYLEEATHGAPLLTGDAAQRAAIRKFCLQIVSNIQPYQKLRVLDYLLQFQSNGSASEIATIKKQWVQHHIAYAFDSLELLARASSQNGEYCFGRALSMADACLVPQVYHAHLFGVDMGKYPTLQHIFEHLQQHEASVAHTRPELQIDAPTNTSKQ